jgi:hypothetical protein
MEWFKKHTDTVVVLAGILSSVIWMNSKFSDMDKRFASLEKDIAIIKTVLVMKGIMPSELASNEKNVEK